MAGLWKVDVESVLAELEGFPLSVLCGPGSEQFKRSTARIAALLNDGDLTLAETSDQRVLDVLRATWKAVDDVRRLLPQHLPHEDPAGYVDLIHEVKRCIVRLKRPEIDFGTSRRLAYFEPTGQFPEGCIAYSGIRRSDPMWGKHFKLSGDMALLVRLLMDHGPCLIDQLDVYAILKLGRKQFSKVEVTFRRLRSGVAECLGGDAECFVTHRTVQIHNGEKKTKKTCYGVVLERPAYSLEDEPHTTAPEFNLNPGEVLIGREVKSDDSDDRNGGQKGQKRSNSKTSRKK